MNATVLHVQEPKAGAKSVKVQFETEHGKTVWAYAGLRDFKAEDFVEGQVESIDLAEQPGSDGGTFTVVKKWGEKPQKRAFGGGAGGAKWQPKEPREIAADVAKQCMASTSNVIGQMIQFGILKKQDDVADAISQVMLVMASEATKAVATVKGGVS